MTFWGRVALMSLCFLTGYGLSFLWLTIMGVHGGLRLTGALICAVVWQHSTPASSTSDSRTEGSE